jgi:hypothetical protein
MTDLDLAKRMGIHVVTVMLKRRSQGIERFASRRVFWTKPREKLLGTKPDKQIAEHLGVAYEMVAQRRRQLGIPPAPTERPSLITPARSRQLGTLTDRDLARRWGVSDQTVRRQRHKLGIAAYDPSVVRSSK